MGNKIPSDEDFARAKAAMRENNRGLDEVCEEIMSRFKGDNVVEAFLFFSPDNDLFGAYILYQSNTQIRESEKSGISSKIRDAVYEGLEKVGRGKRELLKVDFEFDSQENVDKNYEGDYFLRLR